MEQLEQIVLWMKTLHPAWVYLTVFVVAYLENVVPPIPGDMIVVFGGYLAGLGVVYVTPTFVLASVGGAFGFMTMAWVGWRVGPAVFDPRRLRWIPKRPAWKARAWLLTYGFRVVAVNRFLSGLRSVIALAVGAARMDMRETAFWATLSSAAWCALLIGAGYVVGDQWERVATYLRLYGQWVTVLGAIGLAAYLAYRWQAKRRLSREEDEG